MAIYNPNKAVEGIVDMKRRWDNAKATGKDTKPFEEGAVAYYKELRDNGRGDVADYLQKSDSVTAGEYLKTLTPDYKATAGDLQKKSNDVYDWTKDAGSQIAKDYDMVFQTIGVTPTRTDYGKDILGGYGVAADEVYKGTLGGASGENGGNVDSYAAAQANRNKAAMVKEGYGTVLDYYNSIAGNATKWAGDKANALGGFAGLMQGNVTDDRDVVKTAYTTEVQKAAAERAAAAEEYAAEQKRLGDVEKAMLDYTGTKYTADKNYEAKIAASNKTDSAKTAAEDMMDELITKYTKSVTEGDDYYKTTVKIPDVPNITRELYQILNDNGLPYDYRKALYDEAAMRGYAGNLGAETRERYSGESGGGNYSTALADVKANGLDSWLEYAQHGTFSDDELVRMANEAGIDISNYMD